MNLTSKRRQIVRHPEKAYESIVTASVFKYKVEMKEADNFSLLEDNYVITVDKDKSTFSLKWAPKRLILSGSEVAFRLSLPRGSIMDFTTSSITQGQGEEPLAIFSLPEIIDVYYTREYFRVQPSEREPLKVSFLINGIGVISDAKLVDIGLGGMGIEITPCNEALRRKLELGQVIEGLDIIFPEFGVFSFCVRIQHINGCRCGLEFVLNDSDDYSVLVSYLIKRQKETRDNKQTIPLSSAAVSTGGVISSTGVDAVSSEPSAFVDGQFKTRPESAHRAKPRVMIIEQSRAMQERLQKLFVKQGIEVIQSFDAVDGAARTIAEIPDLAIIDMDMPMSSAYECVRSIRLNDVCKNLPICMLSSDVQNPLVMKCAVLGVKEFILKYMDADYVLKRVLGILRI